MYTREMRRITIEPHLDVETLEARYRGSPDGISRSHWQIIWLLASGQTTGVVSGVTGYSVAWIYALVQRYNAQGEAALGDQRHHNPGAQHSLNTGQQAQLQKLLTEAAATGERWTGKRVAAWMSEQLQRPVDFRRGCEMLRRLGFSLQMPRPTHQQANVAEQTRFKKTIPTGWTV